MQRDQRVRIDKRSEGGKVSGRGVRRRGVQGKRSHGRGGERSRSMMKNGEGSETFTM